MTIKQKLKNDIKKLIVNLQKKNLISNPRFADRICTNNVIETGTTVVKNEDEYDELRVKEYDNDKYLFVLDDGSFFQINYRFNSINIESANLSFWPGNIKEKEYIRYDYASNEKDNFYHSSSHIHIGLKTSIRIPVNKILYPSDFVLIILYLYNKEYFEKVKNFYNIDTLNLEKIENATLFSSNKEFLYINYGIDNCNL